MWNPFKREPKHVGPATVDWKPGDMAECVEHFEAIDDPKLGDRALVLKVVYDVFDDNPKEAGWGLWLLGYPSDAYFALGFRKIILTDTGADRKVSKRAPTSVDA